MELERMTPKKLLQAAQQMQADAVRKGEQSRELAALALDRSRQIQALREESSKLQSFYWLFASRVGDALSIDPAGSAASSIDAEWQSYCKQILENLPCVKQRLQRGA